MLSQVAYTQDVAPSNIAKIAHAAEFDEYGTLAVASHRNASLEQNIGPGLSARLGFWVPWIACVLGTEKNDLVGRQQDYDSLGCVECGIQYLADIWIRLTRKSSGM
jgi:hypothetical protein